ncbi:MAG: type II secretion system F family protein [Actinomycetales bacterium]
MSTTTALAACSGILLGTGLWLVLIRLPMMRRPSFAERIEPQLLSAVTGSRLLTDESGPPTLFGPLERILRTLLGDAGRWLDRFNPGGSALTRRHRQAGRPGTVLDFRASQLLWAAAGLAAGILAALLSAASGRFNLLLGVGGVLGLSVGAFLAKDYLLSAQIRRRESRMLAEFPALAELMALAVSAGESATGALERVAASSRGELAKDFAGILARTRSGVPLNEALAEYSRSTRLAPLVRFIDGIIVAVERGTPLAEVLRAQAQDVRDGAKRELMESAGRKEIGMMVPLVFGVLPLTVIFAVFPGLALLDLGF